MAKTTRRGKLPCLLGVSALVFAGALILPCSAEEPSATRAAETPPASKIKPISLTQLKGLHTLIKPQPGEGDWERVPWMVSTDLWAARRKAAAEGKPLFLWYMAGEPLGSC